MIQHDSIDIIDITTVILHKTHNWLVAPPVVHLSPYGCDNVSIAPRYFPMYIVCIYIFI